MAKSMTLALALLGAATGCVEQTELLPGIDLAPVAALGDDGGGGTGDDGGVYACPLRIDVFGANDTLFPSCNGIQGAAAAGPAGYARTDQDDYKASLAGRLKAALDGHYSRSFTVRASEPSALGRKSIWSTPLVTTSSGSCPSFVASRSHSSSR